VRPKSNHLGPAREDLGVGERLYEWIIRTAIGLFRLLDFQFTIEGTENLPDDGGAVLASNHVSYFDFMFVGFAARDKRRLVRFMAKKSTFDNPISGPLMRGMHHIPVDRGAGASSYAAAVTALRAGELVGVFPESTISRAFVPRTFKSGAARMALEAEVPLLPVVVWGGQRVWTTGRRPVRRRHTPVTIAIGPAIEVTGTENAVQLTAVLHERLTKMVEEVQRDYPAPVAGEDSWWQPAYLGGTAPTLEEAGPIEAAAYEARRLKRANKRGRFKRVLKAKR
jgi:1-acyl-sn-glycerol-3-phosphate acyltransferase